MNRHEMKTKHNLRKADGLDNCRNCKRRYIYDKKEWCYGTGLRVYPIWVCDLHEVKR